MSRKADPKTDKAPPGPMPDQPADEGAEVDQAPDPGPPAPPSAALAEPGDEAVARLEREIGEWKDRALRASADFDNYRRRAVKERDEANGRGQAMAFERIIDVIDDLARVAHLDPAKTTAESLHEGMLAIERKFLKTLETAGLERIDPMGQPFDPKAHEAVASLPAPDAESDHTVGAVYQHGYRYKGTLLRPARVAVLQWSPQ